jgi:hypothetical protein
MTGDVARADVVTATVDPYADRDDAVDALFRRHCTDLVRLGRDAVESASRQAVAVSMEGGILQFESGDHMLRRGAEVRH